MKILFSSALLAVVSTAAAAHDSGSAHSHPHGLIAIVAAVVLVGAAYIYVRRRG